MEFCLDSLEEYLDGRQRYSMEFPEMDFFFPGGQSDRRLLWTPYIIYGHIYTE